MDSLSGFMDFFRALMPESASDDETLQAAAMQAFPFLPPAARMALMSASGMTADTAMATQETTGETPDGPETIPANALPALSADSGTSHPAFPAGAENIAGPDTPEQEACELDDLSPSMVPAASTPKARPLAASSPKEEESAATDDDVEDATGDAQQADMDTGNCEVCPASPATPVTPAIPLVAEAQAQIRDAAPCTGPTTAADVSAPSDQETAASPSAARLSSASVSRNPVPVPGAKEKDALEKSSLSQPALPSEPATAAQLQHPLHARTTESPSSVTEAAPRATPIPAAEQVVVHIGKAMAEGRTTIHMKLEPEELGSIDISLSIDHDQHVRATVSADRPQTLDLLRRDSDTLEKALATAGLKTEQGGLNFNLRQGSDQAASQAFPQSQKGFSFNHPARTDQTQAVPMESPTPSAYVYQGALNITI